MPRPAIGIWKKVGISFAILSACVTAVAGYCDTKFKTNENTKDVSSLEVRVEKGFEKIDQKMDEFSHEQTTLKVDVSMLKAQSSEIYRMVKFLENKAKE